MRLVEHLLFFRNEYYIFHMINRINMCVALSLNLFTCCKISNKKLGKPKCGSRGGGGGQGSGPPLENHKLYGFL